jgi:hypothetical protein
MPDLVDCIGINKLLFDGCQYNSKSPVILNFRRINR